MRLSLSSLFLLAGAVSSVLASNVIELTSADYEKVLGQGKPALVEFYADWCGHCKNLAPVYEQLADAFAHAKDKVMIVKTNADKDGKAFGNKYGVTGFPTLKWFSGDALSSQEPAPYEGARDLDSLAAYITEKTGVKSNIKPPPPPAVTFLDVDNFDEVALDDNKDVLVAMVASWCGHCKNLKPIFEKVAQTFKPESNCVVAQIDTDQQVNRPIGSRYGVESFPTIKFFPRGTKEPVEYNGGRSEADFVNYLNEKCGTHRAVGGGLNDFAGRVATLDTFAQQLIAAVPEARAAILKDATSAGKAVGQGAAYYLRVMEKVITGSEAYVEKESKRLNSILAKKSLQAGKLEEIKVKANILAAFVKEKVEEAAQAVKDEL